MNMQADEWGQHLIMDLGGCNPDTIRDGEKIKQYIKDVIVLIGMKAYGEPLAVRFALHDPKVAGYSAFCFLETSNICLHLAEGSNTMYVDIFSCSKIDVNKAVDFTKCYFDASIVVQKLLYRMEPTESKILPDEWI